MTSPRKLLATWFYVGYAPVASGTFGTVAAVPLYLLLMALFGAPDGGVHWAGYALFTAAFTVACFWIADCGTLFWDKADSGKIVIDEVAGYLVTMFLLPFTWKWMLYGFLAFRVFDIAKPWPASYFDRRHENGMGVTMDDAVAGAYACLTLHAIRAWIG